MKPAAQPLKHQLVIANPTLQPGQQKQALPTLTRTEMWLLRIACVDPKLLALPECSHETVKYTVTAWLLILSGIMGAISGGFALSLVTRSDAVFVLGALWGFFLISYDRYFLASYRKCGPLIRSLIMATPRLAMATILAITVTTPVEIRLFKPEISYQHKLDTARDRAAHEIDAATSFPRIPALENEKEELQKQIQRAKGAVDAAFEKEIDEGAGLGITFQVGRGPVFWERKQFRENLESEFQDIHAHDVARIATIDKELADLYAARENAVAEVSGAEERGLGLLASLKAMERIATEPDFGRTLSAAMRFITLLFITIDLAAVLCKILSPAGVYDHLLDAREREAIADASHQADLRRRARAAEAEMFSETMTSVRAAQDDDASCV